MAKATTKPWPREAATAAVILTPPPPAETTKHTYYRIQKMTPNFWKLVQLKDGVETVLDAENIHKIIWAKLAILIRAQPYTGG